jgi:hypothetical protein
VFSELHMSYIADMTALDRGCVGVGWLHPEFPVPQGAVPPAFSGRLKEFARRWFTSVEALGFGVAMGFHTCEFCGEFSASGTFGVPAGNRLFFVPEMIAHYVERHGYAPPSEFIEAVLACPLPGTPEYSTLVARFVEGHD